MDNLPRQITSFIGRQQELADLTALLKDPACRLLTLVGPGGIGKTQLAIQAARGQLSQLPDGVCFVPLAPVASAELLPSVLASVLQITFFDSADLNEQLLHYLHEKTVLLLLDNFEHLLAGAELLSAILQSSAGVKLLVTSRERLNLQEEWVFALAGLHFPGEPADEALEEYSAVQLFVQRARQIQVNFSLSEHAQAVQRICQRVEGMPLGLELAATWLRAMSCQQIAAQIEDNLDFLTTPMRNVPERHRSLRAVFDQSWSLLVVTEREVFMKLAIFWGGFDLEAAEAVAGASLDLLAGLVDKSLVHLNDRGRYDLHELLRQYAAEKLDEAGQWPTTAAHHLDYFLQFAEDAERHIFGRGQIPWFDRLEVEMDNIRAALDWSLRGGDSEKGLQLAAELGIFFHVRDYVREGQGWLERLLAQNPDAPASLRSKALHRTAALSTLLGEDHKARLQCEEALDLARSVDDRLNVAWSLSNLGYYSEMRHQVPRAAAALEESVMLFRQVDDPHGLNNALRRRGHFAFLEANFDYGLLMLDEALKQAEAVGHVYGIAQVHQLLGTYIWTQTRNIEQTRVHYQESMACYREAGHSFNFVHLHILLALAEYRSGQIERAQVLFADALMLMKREGFLWHSFVDIALAVLGSQAGIEGDYSRAARLLGAAEKGVTTQQFVAERVHHDLSYESDVAFVREQLGDAAFDEAWASGQAMSREQIVAYALETEPVPEAALPPGPPGAPALTEAMSERELEVLDLMAVGLSNPEIAERLVLSVNTIKVHVRNIYGKLEVNNRTQAIRKAQHMGLISLD